MAIDDNTSYELTGAQVKDLAGRIKGNAKLAKDLSGGEERTSKLIYIVRLSINDGDEIAEQIGYDTGSTVATTVIYGFREASSGRWLTRDEIGEAIENKCIFKYIKGTIDASDERMLTFYRATPGYDEDEGAYYPKFWFWTPTKDASVCDSLVKWELQDNPNQGLESLYTVSNSTFDLESEFKYIIRPITTVEEMEIADAIHAEHPDIYPSLSTIASYMPYVVYDKRAGARCTTLSSMRAAFRSTIQIDTSLKDKGMVRLLSYYGTSRESSMTIIDTQDLKTNSYTLEAPTSSTAPSRPEVQYLPYIFVRDSTSSQQIAYCYNDDTVTSSAPDTFAQVAIDSNDNIYMSTSNSSASDWKQISNPSDFTGATASTAGTNGLVPAPAAGDESKFLKGDGTWGTAGGGGSETKRVYISVGYTDYALFGLGPQTSSYGGFYEDAELHHQLIASDVFQDIDDGKKIEFSVVALDINSGELPIDITDYGRASVIREGEDYAGKKIEITVFNPSLAGTKTSYLERITLGYDTSGDLIDFYKREAITPLEVFFKDTLPTTSLNDFIPYYSTIDYYTNPRIDNRGNVYMAQVVIEAAKYVDNFRVKFTVFDSSSQHWHGYQNIASYEAQVVPFSQSWGTSYTLYVDSYDGANNKPMFYEYARNAGYIYQTRTWTPADAAGSLVMYSSDDPTAISTNSTITLKNSSGTATDFRQAVATALQDGSTVTIRSTNASTGYSTHFAYRIVGYTCSGGVSWSAVRIILENGYVFESASTASTGVWTRIV